MYYKDEKIEIRLGLGIKAFTSITASLYTFILSRINEDKSLTYIEQFTTSTALSSYPTDGSYRLEVTGANITPYYVFLNINDSFIKEFVKQVKDIVCNCKCGSKCKDSELCRDNLNGNFAIKRQKLFNTAMILPNTIKPFTYGQGAITNPPLYNFIQMFFNETMSDKKAELGKEYFSYYTNGSASNNAELFNAIIAGYYYTFYLYSKTLLLNNTFTMTPSPTKEYEAKINTAFDFIGVKSCLTCYIAGVDFIKLIQEAFIDTDITITASDQNNISRVINVYLSNLSGNGTLEDQIAEFVNTLNYNKTEIDSDIWINYIDEAGTPINCEVSEWSAWSACSIEGTQSRTRTVITAPSNNGTACPILTESRSCTYIPPVIPIDATVTDWSEWSECSIQGSQTRTRTIIVLASGGGTTPALTDSQSCTYVPPPVPVDATVSEWDVWSMCSRSGYQSRSRDLLVPASNGGQTPVLTETRSCTYVPVNNKVGTILSFINDVMTFEVHQEIKDRQFTCGAYDGVELMYQRPGETSFTQAYFNGTLTSANLIYYGFLVGTLLKLNDTIGDLEDSDVFTVTDDMIVQRVLIPDTYSDPCQSPNVVWLDTETNYYYETETDQTLFAGYFYTYVNQVGSDYVWNSNYIENGIIMPEYSGEYTSPCGPVVDGGGGNPGTRTLQSAPYGGCSVTYYDVNNNIARENIPAQDEGLSFSINVGAGGIVSDSCGFS